MTDLGGQLPVLSTVLAADKVYRCSCGSAAFFDWGIRVLQHEDIGKSPRYQDWASETGIKVCVDCHRPVAVWNGDLYDASEFVSPEEVEELLRVGAARQHITPVAVMDP